ncbi:MAG: hypothetical protein HYX89_04600, partial [Chloroflexi bacterium]|nr:hypothetical protein [Chloroflexota bacterium]
LTLTIRFRVPWLGQGRFWPSMLQGALGSILIVLTAMLRSARSLDLLSFALFVGLLVTAEFLLLVRK